jgi:endo-1,3(4)-beta-glucanase
MLPWCPISTYTRSKKFTSEEWNQFFNNYTPKDQSWTGILRGNQALIDPKKSFDFFASSNFKQKYLREGDSRAYYLWFGAILGQI